MKKIFLSSILLISIDVYSQTLCGTAFENGTVTLTAPAGNVFVSIDFASYGTPAGSCGGFSLGGCHAANSQSLVEAAFLGETSGSIDASNGIFGDPCSGTAKWLYVEATYSAILPLKIISFSATRSLLNQADIAWITEDEINTSHFLIERSYNGSIFETMDSVSAKAGNVNTYRYTANVSDNIPAYFRLKIIDADQKSQYSSIVQLTHHVKSKLKVFPNPAIEHVNITGSEKSEVRIIDINGKEIKKFVMHDGNVNINIANWPAGIYFIRTTEGTISFMKN